MSMLEANTDRSYFMIGSIIVAAVLIAGALYVFRDMLFAPVENGDITTGGVIPKLVNKVFGQATDMVEGIAPTTPAP